MQSPQEILNAIHKQDYDSAAAQCELALRESGDELRPLYEQLQVNIWVLQEKYADAIAKLKSLPQSELENKNNQEQLAICYSKTGDYQAAYDIFSALLAENPHHRSIWLLHAQCCQELSNYDEAIEYYQKYLAQRLAVKDVWLDLVQLHLKLQQFDEALAIGKDLLDTAPEAPVTQYILGQCLVQLKNYEAAMPYYLQLLKLPDCPGEYLPAMAQYFNEAGHISAALATLKRMETVDGVVEHKAAISLFVPSVFDSKEQQHAWRQHYQKQLDALDTATPETNWPLYTQFYLAYQGENEAKTQAQFAQYLSRCYADDYVPKKREKSGRPHIGIALNKLNKNSVLDFYDNSIRRLAQEADITYFLLPYHRYAEQQHSLLEPYTELGIKVIDLQRRPLDEIRDTMRAANCDLMIFPEIGMDFMTYCLATNRYAPTQVVLMGHPLTTGLPSIDYYLSSELFEAEDADSHYSETLVRIPGMPINVTRPETQFPIRLAELQIPEQGHRYMVPMLPFKLDPSFDTALIQILQKDPEAQLILVKHHGLEQVIRARLLAKIPEHDHRRLHCIPKIPRELFPSALAQMDVILNTFPFGGGNTALQALSSGSPLVCMQSRFLRGRFCQGYYQHMGVNGLVVDTVDAYSDLAVRLATDLEFQAQKRAEILEKSAGLFDQTEGSDALCQWILGKA